VSRLNESVWGVIWTRASRDTEKDVARPANQLTTEMIGDPRLEECWLDWVGATSVAPCAFLSGNIPVLSLNTQ
jgi:hypothetical protein